VVIIWPYASSASSYVTAGRQVVVPPQRCPTCHRQLIGWGGYWRWLRAPLLVERIWIHRGRCAACRRSHALLPDLTLARRLDVVTVIGTGLLLKLRAGRGLRPIAAQLDVPLTTVRMWWQPFRVRSSTLVTTCTRLAVALDGVPVQLQNVDERAALEVLGIVRQRARARFGAHIGGGSLWSFWSAISGGLALGTHTTSPWAAWVAADWMTASPPGGPAP
jgi:hypothetical protein